MKDKKWIECKKEDCGVPHDKPAAHTPLPVVLKISEGTILDANGDVLCRMPATCVTQAWEDRAAFIVKCVNAYERDQETIRKLVKVLRQAHEMGVTLMDEVVGKKATDWEIVNEAMCAIVKAIARAEGRA